MIGTSSYTVPEPPQWSPDGSRIGFHASNGIDKLIHLYIANADGNKLQMVSESWADLVRWSPDGTQLALAKIEGGKVRINLINVDGSALRQVLEMSPQDFLGSNSSILPRFPT